MEPVGLLAYDRLTRHDWTNVIVDIRSQILKSQGLKEPLLYYVIGTDLISIQVIKLDDVKVHKE